QMRGGGWALHGWDMRSAARPPGHLSRRSLPVLLDLPYVKRGLDARLRSEGAPARPLRIRFEWVGADLGPRDLVIGPPEVDSGPAGGAPAELAVSCHPEVVVLLATGRLDFSRAVGTYGLEVAGDERFVRLFRAGFSKP